MKYEEIKYYIDLSISEFSSIKTVVFTGGECTLLGIRTLAKCINYASSKGLATRIVSNGHWGNSILNAEKVLK